MILPPASPPTAAPKTKQVNIRVTDAQAALLRQHCNRNNVSTQEAVIAALRTMIDGF